MYVGVQTRALENSSGTFSFFISPQNVVSITVTITIKIDNFRRPLA